MVIGKQILLCIAKLVVVSFVLFLASCDVKEDEMKPGQEVQEPSAHHPWILNAKIRKKNWQLFGKHGINIEEAWKITTGNPENTVAIIDGDFLPEHNTLKTGDCQATYEFLNPFNQGITNYLHGARVLGLLSTCPNNQDGLVGVDMKSTIQSLQYDFKYLDTQIYYLGWAMGGKAVCDHMNLLGLIRCKKPNTRKPVVINMSMITAMEAYDVVKYRRSYLRVISWVHKQGGIIVSAGGNESRNADIAFPAGVTGVISAGATTAAGIAWSDSNWGETIEVMAPGATLSLVEPDDSVSSGSSYASSLVAGVISLMRSVDNELNWKTALYFIQSTATPLSCDQYCTNPNDDTKNRCKTDCCVRGVQICTPGIINAGAAVKAAADAAQNGLPRVALVDAEKYYVEMSNFSKGSVGYFKIFNVGNKQGDYLISSSNPALRFDKKKVTLAPKGSVGDSALVAVIGPANFAGESPIRIANPYSRLLPTFTDELILYAQHHVPHEAFGFTDSF